MRFSTGSYEVQCKINSDNSVQGCDFLSVDEKTITGLNQGFGYGYGYGYGYGSNVLGWQDFGYGYGYGYGTRGTIGNSGSGKIVYTLKIIANEFTKEFTNKNINVESDVNNVLTETNVYEQKGLGELTNNIDNNELNKNISNQTDSGKLTKNIDNDLLKEDVYKQLNAGQLTNNIGNKELTKIYEQPELGTISNIKLDSVIKDEPVKKEKVNLEDINNNEIKPNNIGINLGNVYD